MPGDPSGASTEICHSADPALSERVRALERAVTDSDDPPSPVPAVSDVATDVDLLAGRVSDIEATLADLTARQQAVEAYIDRIEHVNDTVERRADAALAAVDRLESTVESNPRAPAQPESAMSDSTSPESTLAGDPPHVSDAASTTGNRHTGAADSGAEPTDDGGSGVLARLLGW